MPENLAQTNYVPNVPDSWHRSGTKPSCPQDAQIYTKLIKIKIMAHQFLVRLISHGEITSFAYGEITYLS